MSDGCLSATPEIERNASLRALQEISTHKSMKCRLLPQRYSAYCIKESL